MKKLLESIDSIDSIGTLDESFDPERNTIRTATKEYHISEVTPEIMYAWVKTDKVDRKTFIAWAVYMMESTYI